MRMLNIFCSTKASTGLHEHKISNEQVKTTAEGQLLLQGEVHANINGAHIEDCDEAEGFHPPSFYQLISQFITNIAHIFFNFNCPMPKSKSVPNYNLTPINPFWRIPYPSKPVTGETSLSCLNQDTATVKLIDGCCFQHFSAPLTKNTPGPTILKISEHNYARSTIAIGQDVQNNAPCLGKASKACCLQFYKGDYPCRKHKSMARHKAKKLHNHGTVTIVPLKLNNNNH
ncbi:hypothetical protein DFH28DRAFT_925867 [Melampsora americana]|nr:hypothetical protein DFH28DRAFT_925867 [Melampsora americana]